ncbi:sensor histidine kinase [Pseudonocardia sp. H11422]|uniref:sensor histidine kinase n=1 Tax=Pseudonocardia sp. H11422 TaxID=2835866 RepID=UPI001BDC64CD|nr:histidine kinase [Pseudonocardia sp. H11422]
MDTSPLAGAEERKVRAARRFGRIGLVITLLWLLTVPAFVIWTGLPEAVFGWPLLALYLAALGLHVWRIREHVSSLGRGASAPFMAAAAAVALAIALLGLASAWAGWIWALVSGVLLGDIVSGLRARWIVVWIGAAAAAVLGLGLLISANIDFGVPAAWWVGPALAAFYVATMWVLDVERLWWLKAVTDLDDSRRAAAELATARERLRLADDLHDILGHALEVVAFKSELATRLLPADTARARTEMEEVQRVARESLSEVRALVRDTRSTDLVTELAGARAVLDTAGVVLTVRGDPETVGPTARNVLGRVLREAMTNVLRHAEPSHCTIDIEVADGGARLEVVNDGALPANGTDPGTGLAALSRYLDEHAGRLDAGPGPGGTFRLDAVLPGAAR